MTADLDLRAARRRIWLQADSPRTIRLLPRAKDGGEPVDATAFTLEVAGTPQPVEPVVTDPEVGERRFTFTAEHSAQVAAAKAATWALRHADAGVVATGPLDASAGGTTGDATGDLVLEVVAGDATWVLELAPILGGGDGGDGRVEVFAAGLAVPVPVEGLGGSFDGDTLTVPALDQVPAGVRVLTVGQTDPARDGMWTSEGSGVFSWEVERWQPFRPENVGLLVTAAASTDGEPVRGVIASVDGETFTVDPISGSGADGRSAYEVAVAAGFEGTVEEWLASLRGPKGDPGEPGPKGDPGEDGRSVEVRATATHIEWRREGDAEWSELVALEDLRGPKGDPGEPGPKGSDEWVELQSFTTETPNEWPLFTDVEDASEWKLRWQALGPPSGSGGGLHRDLWLRFDENSTEGDYSSALNNLGSGTTGTYAAIGRIGQGGGSIGEVIVTRVKTRPHLGERHGVVLNAQGVSWTSASGPQYTLAGSSFFPAADGGVPPLATWQIGATNNDAWYPGITFTLYKKAEP